MGMFSRRCFGKNHAAQMWKLIQIGSGETEFHGEVVDDIDRVEQQQRPTIGVPELGIHHGVERELHVMRGGGNAVVPAHIVAKVDGDLLPVLGTLPGFRQPAFDLQILPPPEERHVQNAFHDRGCRSIRGDELVQRVEVAEDADHARSPVGGDVRGGALGHRLAPPASDRGQHAGDRRHVQRALRPKPEAHEAAFAGRHSWTRTKAPRESITGSSTASLRTG